MAATAIRCFGEGGARIAGRGGAGEGDRGVMPLVREAEREVACDSPKLAFLLGVVPVVLAILEG
jgi:hypothetical protein